MTKSDERIARLEAIMENTCKTVDEFAERYSEFKRDVFERLDGIQDRLIKIETKLETKEDEQKTVLSIRLWLIALSITTILSIVGLFLRR